MGVGIKRLQVLTDDPQRGKAWRAVMGKGSYFVCRPAQVSVNVYACVSVCACRCVYVCARAHMLFSKQWPVLSPSEAGLPLAAGPSFGTG